MTKLIGFGRANGKSTMAILESHATGNQIICANNRMVKNISYDANRMGYAIPQPVSISDPNLRELTRNLNRAHLGVIVDDIELLLAAMLGCQIDTITFDSREVDYDVVIYQNEIANLKAEISRLEKKCVDLMLENADYVCDEMARETAKQLANKRKWGAR